MGIHVNAKTMACGGCGGDTFKIFKVNDDIVAECQTCKSDSIITVEARLEVKWDENATGRLCVFE